MSGGAMPGLASSTEDVIKSPEDARQYRVLVLENGMRVLLVSDPSTDKSAASLDVNVGHLSDPRDLPGLAHFCEHMLFLGTQKFPDENEYHKFLADHGGSANAYTAADHTCYFFDVAPGSLRGALDRFAEFFRTPLFTESCVDREVNAVDSENQNYQKNDMWRLIQMERSFSNPAHDYSKFGTGNRDTLWNEPQKRGQNPREELLKFHTQHYSSNVMRLCIVGKEPLDDLTQMALDRFKDVRDNSREAYAWNDHPWGPEQVGHRLDVVPIKDLRSLHMNFPIPDLHPQYRTQPGHYLSHLLGHEGPGSLLSELKAQGWVSSLSAGARDGARGFAFFNVDVDLSEEGLEHVEDIVKLVFAYVGLLRREGAQEWIHKECAQLNGIAFRFKDKEKPQGLAMGLSTQLHYYEGKEALMGPYIMDEYKPERINAVLDKLRPDNFSALVISNKHKGGADLEKEKWYGTEFHREKFSPAFLDACHEAATSTHPAFKIPAPNAFIPDDFTIKSKTIPKAADEEFGPAIILDDERSRLWHKLDREFLLPKAVAYFHFSSALAYASPLEQALSHMFVVMLTDDLTELTYDATLGGLHYSVENGKYGFTLRVDGYNQKQGVLLKALLERFSDLQLDPARFAVLREAYLRQLRSWKQEQPYKQAMSYNNLLLAQRGHPKEDVLDAAEKFLEFDTLKEFIPRLLSSLHVEALCHGNVTAEEAKASLDVVWDTLSAKRRVSPAYHGSLVRDREVDLPKKSSYKYERDNETHTNSAVEMILQVGTQSTRSNMLLELVAQVISEPAFDTLRTKETLGYIVFSGVRRANGSQGLRVIVQGERDPEFVEARIELFLSAMREKIAGLSAEDLETAREALATQRLEKPKRLSSLAGRFWSEILSQQYDFERDEKEVAELRRLDKAALLAFFDEHFGLASDARRKLVSGVFSAAARAEHHKLCDDKAHQESITKLPHKMHATDSISDMTKWRMYQSLCGLPIPARDIPPLGRPAAK